MTVGFIGAKGRSDVTGWYVARKLSQSASVCAWGRALSWRQSSVGGHLMALAGGRGRGRAVDVGMWALRMSFSRVVMRSVNDVGSSSVGGRSTRGSSSEAGERKEWEGEGEGGCCVRFDVRWCERRDGVKWWEMGEDPSGKAKVTWMWRF